MSDALIESLRRAVEAAPDDVALRVHLADLLVQAGLTEEAVRDAAAALQRDPTDQAAQQVMGRAMAKPRGPAEPSGRSEQAEGEGFDWRQAEAEVADVVPGRRRAPNSRGASWASHSKGSDSRTTRRSTYLASMSSRVATASM
jgi:hypothetical protein